LIPCLYTSDAHYRDSIELIHTPSETFRLVPVIPKEDTTTATNERATLDSPSNILSLPNSRLDSMVGRVFDVFQHLKLARPSRILNALSHRKTNMASTQLKPIAAS
jgi:hypothetical protein